ncbi:MAG TPA: PKD domain-containing protein, partial [Bacteroidales bacterium]|nr:PKD domain-containing protein [Bacteroidales bacterium]
ISLRVRDNNNAWSAPATDSLIVSSGGSEYQLTLTSTYSTDVNSSGTKYYHDGADWVGRGNSGALRAVNRWNISGIDPSWTITSVEVRFYTESTAGSPGTLFLTRYGTSHGEDNPQADTGAQVYSKINNTPYASLPEPFSGSWTPWINLGPAAVADIAWCRMGGLGTWSAGLKASDAIESGTTIRHADFSEDNETNNAELRVTYIGGSSSNTPPTATITSISPNPATAGQTVTFTGSGTDPDGTITAYEWTSSINGLLSTASTFSTSSLLPGTHTISLRVRDNNNAWSAPATDSLIVLQGQRVFFTDDFSADSRSQYIVENTWTNGGIGQFLYDGTNKRLSVLTGDNVGIKFSKIFPSASDTGILQLDFLPTQKYPQGGEFLLKLVQDDLNYYEIYNTDGYGPGMVSKVVNGQVITNEKFMSSYRQNTNYLVQVSFSPTKDVVQAFNDLVFLNTAPTSILVNSFSIELRQQRAYF